MQQFIFQWWQLDMGGLVIRLLEKLGLVWDLKMPTDEMIAAKKRKVSATEAIN